MVHRLGGAFENQPPMTDPASQDPDVVYVVDDDAPLRDVLKNLFRSVGLQAEALGSAKEFLEFKRPNAPSCLVLDVRLPGVSGLDFQAELERAGLQIPIVFMTGHGDIHMSVRAMKAGAVEFLTKPFRDQELIDAVWVALERSREQRKRQGTFDQIKARFDTVTPREHEVIELVVAGLMNKQIAARLDISEVTVKVHRANAMRRSARVRRRTGADGRYARARGTEQD